MLGATDYDKFEKALEDPTLKPYLKDIGTPEFYNAVPKKDES